jgi:hypothetical protein
MEKKSIENYITDRANPVIVESGEFLEQSRDNLVKYHELAERISRETGVVKGRIFINYLLNYVNNWHKIDDKWYFYKTNSDGFSLINELMGVKISKYFGLDTVDYKLAKLRQPGKQDEIGLISENVCVPGTKYLTCWDYNLCNYQNLDVIKYGIRHLCVTPEAYQLFADDIKKLFVRDFYSQQLERTGYNIMLRQTSEGPRLDHLFDYERSFDSPDYRIIRNQFGQFGLYRKQCREYVLGDDCFQESLNRFMDADINSFIEQVEDENGIDMGDVLKSHYRVKEKNLKRAVANSKILR